jgi:hypothetical protein
MKMQRSLLSVLFILISLLVSLISAAQNPSASSAAALMQLAKLTASDGGYNSQFGSNLAASGNTVVAKGVSSIGLGETYVFVKPAAGWGSSTESAKLAPSNGTAGFGAVAISGNTIAISAIETDFVGDVYVFVRPAGGWSGTVTETAILSDSSQHCFGSTISISGDTIVVGTGSAGAIYTGECIFVRPAGGWKAATQANATLNVPFNASSSAIPLAISGDTIVAGVPGNFFGEGDLYVYVKPATGWSGLINPTATLIVSNESTTNSLGYTVAISGNTIIASAGILGQYRGEVFVFVEPASGWTDMTETAKLLEPPNGIAFGLSLSISGNEVVVGAPYATVGFNQLQGAAYVYLKPQGGWRTTSKFNAEISASDGASNDLFGTSVGIGGGNVFAGSPYATVGSSAFQGAAYVFGK